MDKSSEATHTALAIAKLLDMTPRRLQQLAKDGYVPKAARGKYPLVGSVQGYIRYLKARKSRGGAVDHDLESMHPRDRLMHYKAELAKRDLSVRDGELYLAAETDQLISVIFKAINSTLDSIPDVMERDCGLSPEDIYPVFLAIDTLRDSIVSSVEEMISKED